MAKKIEDTTVFLLVEDDDRDRMLVEFTFGQMAATHVKLTEVIDGAEAISYLKREGRYADSVKYPMPNVILLDLKMPRVTGFEFLQWLRKESPEQCRTIPVIIMSSSGEKKDVSRAYELGANTYLVKPIDWHLFQERLMALGIYWAKHAETPERHR